MAEMIENEDGINYGVRSPETAGDLMSVLGAARSDAKLTVRVGGEEKAVTVAGVIVDDEGVASTFVIDC